MLSRQLCFRTEGNIKTSGFHEHGPTAALYLLGSEFHDWKQAVWNAMMVDKTFYKSTDGNLVEALSSGFAKLYLECPFQ